jgi:multidrug transporter EmrE-like cation transporter
MATIEPAVRAVAASAVPTEAYTIRLLINYAMKFTRESVMGYVFLTVALTLNATANLLMKMGADRIDALGAPGMLRGILTNQYLVGGIVLFGLNIVFYVAALTRMNLSIAYPVMMAGGVLIVVAVSVLYFRESLTLAQVAGILLLMVGLVLVTHRAAA